MVVREILPTDAGCLRREMASCAAVDVSLHDFLDLRSRTRSPENSSANRPNASYTKIVAVVESFFPTRLPVSSSAQ